MVRDAFSATEPVASPDGKFVVFVSDRAGGEHLFRVDIDGANLRQLTFGDGDGEDGKPDISPDGSWIIYSSFFNDQNRIWNIPRVGGGIPTRIVDEESSLLFFRRTESSSLIFRPMRV